MTESQEKHTVSMHFVNAAVSHLAADGRARALATAGIRPQLLDAPNARVPATAYSALWLAVARELGDEFFGLDSRAMKVGSFALICQAVLSCDGLEHALKRMLRAFALLLDDIQAELSLANEEAVIRITNRIQDKGDRRFAEETLLVLLHGSMCWLAGRRISITRILFAHERPEYAKEYSLMYSDNIGFSAGQTSMHFSAQVLALPIVQTAATLQQFLRTAPQSVFLKYRNEESWTARIRHKLRLGMADVIAWPVFEQMAEQLGTTAATLRRRLNEEGTSYQSIKDELRSDCAIDYLCNGDLSVDEIAIRLGFQDASAFHRAFRRWNGIQPGEYRRRQSTD